MWSTSSTSTELLAFRATNRSQGSNGQERVEGEDSSSPVIEFYRTCIEPELLSLDPPMLGCAERVL